MEKKRGIIFGVANDRSLAWGIARELAAQGAEIAFAYQGEVLKKRVEPLAHSIGSTLLLSCDVSEEGAMSQTFKTLRNHWESIDFALHAISFSDKKELRGDFLQLSRENFLRTMDISCYSFVDMTREAAAMMPHGGSILTLSYYGSEKIVPHYNGMALAKAALEAGVRYAAEDLGKHGIRVNTLSCGPIKTLAASGIGDFQYILDWNGYNSPLRRNITLEDAGKAGLFLLSDMSSGVTAETLYVDAGYHAVGMKAKDAPDIALPQQ